MNTPGDLCDYIHKSTRGALCGYMHPHETSVEKFVFISILIYTHIYLGGYIFIKTTPGDLLGCIPI